MIPDWVFWYLAAGLGVAWMEDEGSTGEGFWKRLWNVSLTVALWWLFLGLAIVMIVRGEENEDG